MVSRRLWTWVVAVVAVVFWLIGAVGGWRARLIVADGGNGRGPVGQLQAFGEAATAWWVPAAVLTLTVVLLGVGTAIVRILVDGPPSVAPIDETAPGGVAGRLPPLPPSVAAAGELEPAPDDVTAVDVEVLDDETVDEQH